MMNRDEASSTADPIPSTSEANGFTGIAAKAVRWLPPLAIVVGILGLWEAYVRVFNVQKWLLPAPTVIIETMVDDAGLLSRHTLTTAEEVIVGFVMALVAGVILASVIALSTTIERAIYPFVIASQTIPIIVIAPLLLIWIGYGLAPKFIVVALIAFFPIVVNTVDGLKSVDPDSVRLMRTLGANRRQIFMKLQLPASLPFLFSGAKIAIAVSVIGAVIGEWVGSSQGLGYLMIRSKPQFLTERVFAAIVVLSVMGIALFALIGLIERYSIPWWHNERQKQAIGNDQ